MQIAQVVSLCVSYPPSEIPHYRVPTIMAPTQSQATLNVINNAVPCNELRQVSTNGKKSCARCAQLKVKCLAQDRGSCPKCIKDNMVCTVQTPLNVNRATAGVSSGYLYNLDLANKAKDEIIMGLLSKFADDPFGCWTTTPAEDSKPESQPSKRVDYNKLCLALGLQDSLRNWEPTSWLYDYRNGLAPAAQPSQNIQPGAVNQVQHDQPNH